jgi:hypothetical protein
MKLSANDMSLKLLGLLLLVAAAMNADIGICEAGVMSCVLYAMNPVCLFCN